MFWLYDCYHNDLSDYENYWYVSVNTHERLLANYYAELIIYFLEKDDR